MAVDYNRQYIGARYVPTFFNNPDGSWDWAQGFQYEPLTIVKYGSSTFTSKKLVPSTVGAPNTAPAYWVLTGEYNGAIVQIQNDISELQNTVSILDSGNRNIVLMCDSYGAYPTEETSFANLFKTALEKTENTVQIIYQGGLGLGTTPNAASLYNPQNPLNVTDVIWCGGINDTVNTITSNMIYKGLNSLVNKIKTISPKAKLSVIYNGGRRLYNTDYNILQTSIYYQRYCGILGVKYIPGGENILYNYSYFTDTVHPTEAGANELAQKIVDGFLCGNIEVKNNYSVTYSGDTFSNITILFNIRNGVIMFNIPATNLTYETPVTISNPILIGSSLNAPVGLSPSSMATGRVIVIFEDNINDSYDCGIYIQNNSLYLNIYSLPNKTVKTIQIRPIHCIINRI